MGTNSNKSNYLVQGTILAVASIIAKIIGMIYRIPLTNILGDEGNGYYTTANQIYTIFLMISTFSLPLAVSKLVSERINLGQYRNAHRVFKCAMKFSAAAGGVMSLFTFFFAGIICSSVMKVDNAVYALRVISPAIFVFAIAGVFRGYFQGYGSMVPTAVSQLIEQIVNAFVSVIGAALLFESGAALGSGTLGPAYGAAGGTLGTVVSVSVALVVLVFIYGSHSSSYKRNRKRDMTKVRESDSAIYRAIIATILPVILSTVIYNITPLLDQFFFNRVLLSQGYSREQYTIIYGIYSGKFYVLANVPLALASSLAPSVVPALSAAVVQNDYRDAKLKIKSTMRYTMILTIPCAVGMSVLAAPIMQLLFNDTNQLPANIMRHGGLMIILFAISTLTTAVLQGINKMRDPVRHSAIALVIHILVLYVLLRRTYLNIYSVLIANTLFALLVSAMNAFSIMRYLHYKQEIKKTFVIPMLSATFMGISASVAYFVFNRLFLLIAQADSYAEEYMCNAFAVMLSILIAVFVYAFFLIRLKGIRVSEIKALPKGNTICRILKKIRFI